MVEMKRYAVVSCHVERPLDDRAWALFAALQRRRPGGFRIAALMRPPDRNAGEDEERWIERARSASDHGPFGHHTHFGGRETARPQEGGSQHAERVRSEAEWLRGRNLRPRFWCGGGWYIDEAVAEAIAGLGYADCSATAFRPSYLPARTPRMSLSEPAWIRLQGGRLLELPSTHSLGRAARSALGLLPGYVHVYFHDTDLLDLRRRVALVAALTVLGRRRHPSDLTQLAAEVGLDAPEVAFSRVFAP
jgi:hypothetical protein